MTDRKPLVFLSDFDDTLYFHDGRGLLLEDIEAVQQFQSAGNLFVLCTGRPVCMKKAIEEKTAGKIRFDMEIYSCGAFILDSEQNILFEKQLPLDFILYALEKYPDLNFRIHTEQMMYFTKHPETDEGTVLKNAFKDLEGKKIFEMSVTLEDELCRQAAEKLGMYPGVSCYRNRHIADFVCTGVSKASGLRMVCQAAGADEKSSGAMGDSFNDIPMIEAAEFGFTFPDSDPEVKAASRFIETGISSALKRMLEYSETDAGADVSDQVR